MYRTPRALSNFISLTFPTMKARVIIGLKCDPEILPENMIVTNMPSKSPALSETVIPECFSRII